MHNEIISQLEGTLERTMVLLSSFSEKELNTIPFEGSWSAAQVGRHLYKSENGTDTVLVAPSQPVERDPGERIQGLKDIFLNFESKMKSPDFIVPEEIDYDKNRLIGALKDVKDKLIPAAKSADLSQLAPLPDEHPLKGTTKLEIVHFLTYHTMRHNHQIENIKKAL